MYEECVLKLTVIFSLTVVGTCEGMCLIATQKSTQKHSEIISL